MPHPDAQRWDERYSSEQENWVERKPSPLLLNFAHILPDQGIALDAACGLARNGLFLAQRSLSVIALDISEVALRSAMQRAKSQSLRFAAAVYDLANLRLPRDHFDVILNFLFLERATFPIYNQALKPGGILFFETFLKDETDLDHPHYYLERGELRKAFEGFEIIHWEEGKITAEKEHPSKWTARLIARKPPQ
jgi:tellurite methyltransferase